MYNPYDQKMKGLQKLLTEYSSYVDNAQSADAQRVWREIEQYQKKHSVSLFEYNTWKRQPKIRSSIDDAMKRIDDFMNRGEYND